MDRKWTAVNDFVFRRICSCLCIFKNLPHGASSSVFFYCLLQGSWFCAKIAKENSKMFSFVYMPNLKSVFFGFLNSIKNVTSKLLSSNLLCIFTELQFFKFKQNYFFTLLSLPNISIFKQMLSECAHVLKPAIAIFEQKQNCLQHFNTNYYYFIDSSGSIHVAFQFFLSFLPQIRKVHNLTSVVLDTWSKKVPLFMSLFQNIKALNFDEPQNKNKGYEVFAFCFFFESKIFPHTLFCFLTWWYKTRKFLSITICQCKYG